MRIVALAFVAAALAAASFTAHAVELEKPAAFNGAAYAPVFPLFDGSTGSTSFLRLFNGSSSATTFTVLVVNTTTGLSVGTASIQVAANASPQYAVSSGAGSVFALAGVSAAAGSSYALYIQNTNPLAGYEHVTYNGTSTLFENASVCATPVNQQLAASNRQVLTNVHTTALAGNNYPSVISIHNYAAASSTVTLAAYDGATGAAVGQVNQTIAANGTLTLSESQLETLMNFRPTSAQLHINLFVTTAAGGALTVSTAQSIRNIQLGGEINMATACAVNAVTTAAVTTGPTAYCGSFRPPAPYNVVLFTFTMSVAANGRVRGTTFASYMDETDGDVFTGTLTGTSYSMTGTYSGAVITGTIQNGAVTGSGNTDYGRISFTGTTAGCS